MQTTTPFLQRRQFALARRPEVKLYHAEVFMPANDASKLVFSRLEWSQHAKMELAYDELGVLPSHAIPRCFFGVAWELIELETTDGAPTKYVFRRTVQHNRDLIIVLRPLDKDTALVVTCWTNRSNNKHRTLDKTKYSHAL